VSLLRHHAPTTADERLYAHDELGRLLKSIGAATQETMFSYDRTDLNFQVKDPRNYLYGYSYDSLARLVQETNEAGAEVTVTRNGQDDVTSNVDSRAITTGVKETLPFIIESKTRKWNPTLSASRDNGLQ
jgi:YD repeat-containing protein